MHDLSHMITEMKIYTKYPFERTVYVKCTFNRRLEGDIKKFKAVLRTVIMHGFYSLLFTFLCI